MMKEGSKKGEESELCLASYIPLCSLCHLVFVVFFFCSNIGFGSEMPAPVFLTLFWGLHVLTFTVLLPFPFSGTISLAYVFSILCWKCLEHRQIFIETNKQSAAARQNRTPRNSDVIMERYQSCR